MAFELPIAPPSGLNAEEYQAWKTAHRASISGAIWDQYNSWNTKINTAQASLSQWQNAWKPMQWEGSDWQTRYNQQQGGMDDLAAQIRGWDPGSSANMAGANQYAAGLAGMTPEQYAALQQEYNVNRRDTTYAVNSDLSAAMAGLDTIANSAFGQEMEKANRVALRQMEAQIGKQLESIFGERGGMGGFQAAYELTSQLQSSYLQQKAQQNLGMFNQAVSAVNANNQYFQQLIQQGAISGKDYLQFRFDQLQTGYQNYLMSMSQTMQEWQTLEQVDESQFRQVSANIESQINQLTDQMVREMGGYSSPDEYLDAMYARWEADAINESAIEDSHSWTTKLSEYEGWIKKGNWLPGAGVVWLVLKIGSLIQG